MRVEHWEGGTTTNEIICACGDMSCLHQHTGDKHNMSGDAIQLNEHMTERKGMQENPERSGTERNRTEPEVVINGSSCTTNFAQYFGS